MLQGQAVCKDCGNGTLNNEQFPAFELLEFDDDCERVVCRDCGGDHIDGELYFEEEDNSGPRQDWERGVYERANKEDNARLTENDEENQILDERE
jgi:hypothetical protein